LIIFIVFLLELEEGDGKILSSVCQTFGQTSPPRSRSRSESSHYNAIPSPKVTLFSILCSDQGIFA